MRDVIRAIISITIWAIIFLPFWLPNRIKYKILAETAILKAIKYQPWIDWYMTLSLGVMIVCAWLYIWELSGKLYDYIVKQD